MWNRKVARLNLCISFQLTDELDIHHVRQKRVKNLQYLALSFAEHTQMERFVKRQIIAIERALLLIIARATTFIRLITL